MEKTCFLDSSTQHHVESSRNFLKNSVYEPHCTKLDEKSEHGHEDVIFTDRLGPNPGHFHQSPHVSGLDMTFLS